eukprot:scaffold650_cov201-Ochromonas_danica.AAC.6
MATVLTRKESTRSSIRDLLLRRGSSHRSSGGAFASTNATPPNNGRLNIGTLQGDPKFLEAHNAIVMDRNESSMVMNSEIQFINPTLVDAMTLTLRQLTIMEYLPEKITWLMLRPLILESLPTFLMET